MIALIKTFIKPQWDTNKTFLNSRLQYLEFEVTVAVDVLGGTRLMEHFGSRCTSVDVRADLTQDARVVRSHHQVVHRRLEGMRIVVINVFLRFGAIWRSEKWIIENNCRQLAGERSVTHQLRLVSRRPWWRHWYHRCWWRSRWRACLARGCLHRRCAIVCEPTPRSLTTSCGNRRCSSHRCALRPCRSNFH